MLLEVGIFLWILGKSGMLGSADGFHGEWGLEGILEGMGKEGMRMGGRKWEKGMGEEKKEMGKGNGRRKEGNGKREWYWEWREWERERREWDRREWEKEMGFGVEGMGKKGLGVEGMGLGVGEDPCSAFLGKRNPQGCSQGSCEPHESSQGLGLAAPWKFGIPRAGSADPCRIQLWDAPCEELPRGIVGI